MGQGRDGGVEILQRIGRPRHCAGGQFRPRSCQRALFGEGGSSAVRVRAAPDTLGPEQPHRPAETGNVMKPDLPAPVAHRNDATVRTTGKILTGLDVQNQARSSCGDGTDVDALDTEQRIRARAPPTIGTRHRVIHVRVSFGYWLLGRYQFKEALTSFAPHHAAPKTAGPAAALSSRLNHAHLRSHFRIHSTSGDGTTRTY